MASTAYKWRNNPIYEPLSKKIRSLQDDESITLKKILNILYNCSDINWSDILIIERERHPNWPSVSKRWKYELIKSYLTKERFSAHGGDRKSAAWKARGAQQQSIIACVQDKVLQQSQDLPEWEVVKSCKEVVEQRWRPVDEKKTMVLHETVEVIVRAVRRQRKLCENGQQVEYTEEEKTTLKRFDKVAIVEEDQGVQTREGLSFDVKTFDHCIFQNYSETIQSKFLNLFEKIIETEKLRVETEKLRIEKHLEGKQVDREPDRLLAEAARLKETRLLLIAEQRRPASKRKASNKDEDHLLQISEEGENTINNGEKSEERPPPHKRTVKLPVGSVDLVSTVIDYLSSIKVDVSVDEHAWIARLLEEQFVAPLSETWAILWAPRPRDRTIIPTYLDLQCDPILPKLSQWVKENLLLKRNSSENDPHTLTRMPPSYPVKDVLDPRPTEEVPTSLRSLNPEVWEFLEKHGLRYACSKVLHAYHATSRLDVPIAHEPENERLRQWKRLTTSCAGVCELTFANIYDCLGWESSQITKGDASLIQVITQCLLPNDLPVSQWYIKRGSTYFWSPSTCLLQMRIAAIFVSRIKQGGADCRFLANDIRMYTRRNAQREDPSSVRDGQQQSFFYCSVLHRTSFFLRPTAKTKNYVR